MKKSKEKRGIKMGNDKYTLEVCVDSVESAMAEARGGADRLELCSNLLIGGTTPTAALFREIRKQSDIRIHVLIRPRFGDFCYSDYEFNIIREEVKLFRELGAQGVVIGILQPDGSLDMNKMKELMQEAGDMSVTLHRAFDVCRDPFEALEQAKELGIRTILTSGQKNTCMEGMELLKQLAHKADGKLEIMAGSGVDAQVISRFLKDTEIRAYHMSGKVVIESSMLYRNMNVSMGLPVADEYVIWQTSQKKISDARKILDSQL